MSLNFYEIGLTSTFGMMERWNGGIMEEEENTPAISPFCNLPKPIIPLFRYSIIPVVSEANYVLKDFFTS
jgi:hypothetical protein